MTPDVKKTSGYAKMHATISKASSTPTTASAVAENVQS
jgi:hypothetical protein